MKRIRVLHVHPDLKAGVQLFVFTIAPHFDPEQFQFHVASIRYLDERRPERQDDDVEVTHLHHAPRRGVLTFLRLIRLIRARRIDIVHTHSFLDRLFAHPAAFLCRVPVVHTLNMACEHSHDLRPRESLRERGVLWVRHLLRRWLERAVVERYIAISQAVYDSFAPVVPDATKRLALVYYGVPTEAFARPPEEQALRALRAELQLGAAYPVLLNVARLATAQKDQHTLLRAMPSLLGQFPQTRLLLVGEGKDRVVIERDIESLGLRDAVSVLGSRLDISALMAVSDIFVLPSRHEGFGVAVAEAMAAGKPVVASRVAPLTELVADGESGYLVDPGDPGAFASAIGKLAEDRGLARAMGLRGQQVARQRFDITTCAEGWRDVYLQVARSRSIGRKAQRSA